MSNGNAINRIHFRNGRFRAYGAKRKEVRIFSARKVYGLLAFFIFLGKFAVYLLFERKIIDAEIFKKAALNICVTGLFTLFDFCVSR